MLVRRKHFSKYARVRVESTSSRSCSQSFGGCSIVDIAVHALTYMLMSVVVEDAVRVLTYM